MADPAEIARSRDLEIYGWGEDGKPLYRPKGLGDVLATALAKDRLAEIRAQLKGEV